MDVASQFSGACLGSAAGGVCNIQGGHPFARQVPTQQLCWTCGSCWGCRIKEGMRKTDLCIYTANSSVDVDVYRSPCSHVCEDFLLPTVTRCY